MRNKFIKFISIICVAIVTLSCVACGSGNNDKNYVISDLENHYARVEPTGKFVVENSFTEYNVLVPSNPSTAIKIAGEQLTKLMFESTGARLNVVYDNLAVEGGKYISLGNTTLFKQTELLAEENLGEDGFKISTVGENVYIYGNTDDSVVYGTFEYLTHTTGFDYLIDRYYIEDRTEIELMNYDVVEIPDFKIRGTDYAFIIKDLLACYMTRMEAWKDPFLELPGGATHVALSCYPPAIYNDPNKPDTYHPKWYAQSGTQLSYTAQGDEEEYELMVDVLVGLIKNALIKQPGKTLINFGGNDDQTFDESDAQKEINKTYGAESAAVILFLNDVSEKVRAWFETEEGKPHARDLTICASAYFRTETPPVEYNEQTGKYEGVNGIKCAEGVGIKYAPINIDYTYSVWDERNKVYMENIKKWSAVTDYLYVWSYGIFFHDFFIVYDNFYHLQEMFQSERDLGVKFITNQGDSCNTAIHSAFGNLRCYLESKLEWNCDLDVNKLIEGYFDKYFGKMSDEMFEYFNDVRTYIAFAKEYREGYSSVQSCQGWPKKEEIWEKNALLHWYDELNKILAELENYYAKGSEEYQLYYDRIAIERLSPIYLLLELYAYSTPVETRREWFNTFKTDNSRIGGARCWANGSETEVSIAKYPEWSKDL